MKTKQLLSFLLLASLMLCAGTLHAQKPNAEWSDRMSDIGEWQDPSTKVNYRYYVFDFLGLPLCRADVIKSNVSGNVSILSKIYIEGTEYEVWGIEEGAFEGCSSLNSVTIPYGVSGIGDGAFKDCSSLTSFTMMSDVNIGEQAVEGCGDLSVTFHCSNIENFKGNTNIKKVKIGEEVTSIESGAFEDCSNLTSITIMGDETTNIGKAFEGFSNLTVTFHCSHIWSWFEGITNIRNVIMGNEVRSISQFAFQGCTGLTTVRIRNGLESIGDNAFYGCTSLTSVTIPNSVTRIGRGAFAYCSALTSITIPESVTRIEGSYNSYKGTFEGCTGLTSVTIPNSVTSIGNYAFSGCSGLTSVTIPNSVTSIEDHAFDGCSRLTSVSIPNSVTNIGLEAFEDCSSLTSVTIPNGVTNIEFATF